VFVRVYRSLEQYDPQAGDLANWLMRLARNLVIDDYRKRGMTAGAVDYLTKPFDPDRLLEAIRANAAKTNGRK